MPDTPAPTPRRTSLEALLPILLFLALGGGLAYLSFMRARTRRRALGGLARKLGLAFDPAPDRSLHHDYDHPFFRRGRSGMGVNSIFGTLTLHGRPLRVRMGDFRYVTGSGKNRRTHVVSYAVFQLPFVGTPDLAVRNEHLGHRLVEVLGFDDIDFESEEFSRRFRVTGPDRRYAWDVIHPEMMEFLLRGPTPSVEIVDDACLVLEGRRRWDPGTFEGAVAWFAAFLERWPEHLTARLRRRGERSA